MLAVAQCNNTQLPLKLRFINVACVAEKLQELKEKEKEAEYFTKMPSKHYMEISSLLLSRSVINRGYHMATLWYKISPWILKNISQVTLFILKTFFVVQA